MARDVRLTLDAVDAGVLVLLADDTVLLQQRQNGALDVLFKLHSKGR